MKSKKSTIDIGIWGFIKRLYKYVKPHKKWLFISIGATIVSAICDFISIIMIKQMIDSSISKKYDSLIFIIFEIVIMVVAGFISKYYMIFSAGRLGASAVRDMRRDLVEHIENTSVSYIEKGHSGDMISRMTNDMWVVEGFIVNDFPYALYIPLIILSSVIYLSLINLKLLLICYFPLPIIVFFTSKITRRTIKYAREYSKCCGEVNSIIQDTIGGIGIMKAFNLEKPLLKKAKDALKKGYIQGMKRAKLNLVALPASYLTREVPFILCVIFGGMMAINGEFGASSLVAFLQLLRMLVNPTMRLPMVITNTNNTMGASSRIFEVLDKATEREDGEIIVKATQTNLSNPVIEFSNIVFRYNEDQNILNGLSFMLKPNTITALVGSSGCGKSTIINLICGFYKISEGMIKIYGSDMNSWKLSSIRDNLAVVSQDTYLFPDTIEENIRFGRSNATEEEIIEAAKAAYADDFIMETPLGYKTLVGERGIKLSGGQRQRISLARAILKNAPILLLDEPTSALDTQSEAIVQEALEGFAKNRTVLVIAHRLSTIKQADNLLVLDNGSISESGTHDELMNIDGLYKQLYDTQFTSSNGTNEDSIGEGA